MPPEAIAHIIQETEPKAIFTEIQLMGTLSKANNLNAKDKQKHQPDFVIYTGEEFEGPEALSTFKQQQQDKDVAHWNTILEEQQPKAPKYTPKPKDLALIMYT